jgi:ankyrin repeat protein
VTPLHDAVSQGHTAIVELLITVGADVNAAMRKGETPLHWASHRGDLNTVQLLLAHGADPTAKDMAAQTPLDLARAQNHSAVAKVLADTGK